MFVKQKYHPVSRGCWIRQPNLCRKVRPPPFPHRGHQLAVGGDAWCLKTVSWLLNSNWPCNQVVKSLAIYDFGPYWAWRQVKQARSDQSTGRVKPKHLYVLIRPYFQCKLAANSRHSSLGYKKVMAEGQLGWEKFATAWKPTPSSSIFVVYLHLNQD